MSSDSDSYGPRSYKTCGYPHEKFVKALATLDERSANQSKQLDALGRKFDDTSESLHERITTVKESITTMGTEVAREIGKLQAYMQSNGNGAARLEKQKEDMEEEITGQIPEAVQAEMKKIKAEEDARQAAAASALLRSFLGNWRVWLVILGAVAGGGGIVEIINRVMAALAGH